MQVAEIFHSIQGESSYAGLPCVFIRLTGCNLRCAYCDTAYAYAGGETMDIERILNRARSFHCDLIEITGGEPLLQAQTPELAARLLDSGVSVLVETNGSLDISLLDARCVRVMDIKCPSSREAARFDALNLGRLTARDQVKLVIADATDYAYARQRLADVRAATQGVTVLFAPVFDVLPAQTLAYWLLRDKLDVRLNLQLHKYVWPPETRGV